MSGMGIGLPVSRLYARHWGGDIRLISVQGCECCSLVLFMCGGMVWCGVCVCVCVDCMYSWGVCRCTPCVCRIVFMNCGSGVWGVVDGLLLGWLTGMYVSRFDSTPTHLRTPTLPRTPTHTAHPHAPTDSRTHIHLLMA
jgi:hypothetical protein